MERTCKYCGDTIQSEHFEFCRRVEAIQLMEVDGKTVDGYQVFYDEVLIDFCNDECWIFSELDIARAFQLKETWPSFSGITPCGRCGKPVNLALPHVALNVQQVRYEEGPEEIICHMIQDETFAVLCRDCDPPVEAEAEAVEEERPVTA